MNKPLILVVEDDAPVRNLITTTLKANDYQMCIRDRYKGGIKCVKGGGPFRFCLQLGL